MKKGKDAPAEEGPVLGKVGTHLKIGIVGLPNVGKSTMFNVLTKMGVPAEVSVRSSFQSFSHVRARAEFPLLHH